MHGVRGAPRWPMPSAHMAPRPRCPPRAAVPTAAGSWASDYVLGREHARLTALLAAMPTSEAQDAALLAAGEPRGWRQQLAVQFCLCRKRALRLALEQMEGAWAAAHPGDVVANASAAADAAEHCQLALGSSSLEHSAAAGAAAAACPLPASHSSARGMSRLRALLAQAAGEAVYAARMWDWQPACVPLLLGAAALAVVRRGQYAF